MMRIHLADGKTIRVQGPVDLKNRRSGYLPVVTWTGYTCLINPDMITYISDMPEDEERWRITNSEPSPGVRVAESFASRAV